MTPRRLILLMMEILLTLKLKMQKKRSLKQLLPVQRTILIRSQPTPKTTNPPHPKTLKPPQALPRLPRRMARSQLQAIANLKEIKRTLEATEARAKIKRRQPPALRIDPNQMTKARAVLPR